MGWWFFQSLFDFLSCRRPSVSNRVPVRNTVRPQFFRDFHFFIWSQWNHLRLVSGSFRTLDFLKMFLSLNNLKKTCVH